MLGMAALAVMVGHARAEDIEPRAALAAAIRLYLAGEPAPARAELMRVLALGPALDAEVRQEAYAYLGDILFSEEGPDASVSVFASLLAENPDFEMDPFEHPPEVCAYFDALRRELHPEAVVQRVVPPEPFPLAIVLPGGAWYFSQREWAPALVVGGLQTGSAVVSLATWLQIKEGFTRREVSEEAALTELIWFNRVAVGVGYLSWAVPIVVETASWDRQRRLSVQVSASTVTVTGTF